MRARNRDRSKGTRGVRFMECCGRVCDERCRTEEMRERNRRAVPTGIPRVVA